MAFGDVDGNGTRDGIVVNFQDPSRLWNNDGTGKFSVSGQSFGSGTNHGGDLVDIDVVTGNSAFNGGVTKLWVNQSAPSTGEVILPVNTNDHLHVYPNPVIRDVTISFSLERETSLKLMLFDVSMRMVGLLAEGLFSQGEYRVMRVLDSFSDGLYHVLMLSDDSGSIHRILVKEAN
ncbi:MAG: hypothetical protein JXA23_09770 [Bacteroidales bacterium]|nr:hypothetical protein [Bacteroidales bacterium]